MSARMHAEVYPAVLRSWPLHFCMQICLGLWLPIRSSQDMLQLCPACDVTWFERVDERRTLDVVLADLAYSRSFLP